MVESQLRTYGRASSIVFLKTNEEYGGLSNMAGGYPLSVEGQRILTSEALYQCCRFPHMPEVQQLIVEQASPMTAKMKSKPYRKQSRKDWDQVRVKVMRWCLRVKLVQNWRKFSELLLRTGDLPIVEESRRDVFWGAKADNEQILLGMNVLGRLLMELREAVKEQGRDSFKKVEPLNIPNFKFLGMPIGPLTEGDTVVSAPAKSAESGTRERRRYPDYPAQGSLFDSSSVRDSSEPSYGTKDVFIDPSAGGIGRYPRLKDTGVPWLSEVPEHWRVLPHRAIFDEVKERDCPDADMLSVTISRGVIRQQALLADSSKKDSSKLDKSAYKLVRPGDIAYNKMRAWQGAIGVSEYEGIVSPAYVVQRPRVGVVPRYLHYLLRTPAFAKEAERWSYGITSDMWSLRPEHFKLIYSCVPPIPEQAAIACFLDHADRRIRRYIRAKQMLIKLLEEQKQAIIHRAVTRGLDPNACLKPSGVKWLGDLPEHWEALPLRRRWSVTDCKHLTVPFVDEAEGIPLASVREVQSFELSLAKAKRTTEKSFKSLIEGGRQPRRGDLIYCRNVSVGAAAIVTTDEPLAMGQDVCLIRSKSESQRYLNYFLRSPAMKNQLALLQVGSTFNRINVSDIKALVIAVPPREEQEAIVDVLDAELADINRAQNLATNEMSLLHEYRTCLIADVVSGKLDVREAAAGLPEESDEQDSDELADPEAIDILDQEPEAEEV